AACPRVIEFLDNQGRRTLADDKSVAQFVERSARQFGGAFPLTHRFDQGISAKGERTQWRFGASGNNDVGKIVADVAQRFTHRHRATGATIRIRRPDSAKTKLNRNVRVRRTAENLQREGGVYSPCALLQRITMLIFGIEHATERGSKT